MRFSFVACCAVLAGTVSAALIPAKHVLHEKREGTSHTFRRVARAEGAAFIPVRIGLTQNNLEAGPDMLMDISHPESTNYAKYLTGKEIEELFAPAKQSVDAVRGWLVTSGISAEKISQSSNKQWLQFDSTLADLENLIHTNFYQYKHADGRPHIACEEYYLPEHVTKHVDYITPGLRHIPVGKRAQKRSAPENSPGPGRKPLPVATNILATQARDHCSAAITPDCIRKLYNITLGTKKNPANKLGIYETGGDHYSQQDLNDFFKELFPRIPQGTAPELRGIDGAYGPNPVSESGTESMIDFEIAMPIVWPQGTVLFQEDDEYYETHYSYPGFFNHMLEAIDGSYCAGKPSPYDPPYPNPARGGYKGERQCGVYEPTNVISISWGNGEIDIPTRYQKRQCNEFMKLSMQGVSIVSATGDNGVASFPGAGSANGCLNKNQHYIPALDPTNNGTIFHPGFPNNCPYISAIGSTGLPPGADASKNQEVATFSFPSAGGFSNLYPAPDYQKAAIRNYLTKYPPPYKSYSTVDNKAIGANGGLYNSNGRANPDFAAIGDNILGPYRGQLSLAYGTSASAPLFASILTRINEERLAVGKKSVGFVNPTLYAHPEVFHDITVGSNPGCNTDGFRAAPGWDPVTGLGTPNYPAMLKLFMSLP